MKPDLADALAKRLNEQGNLAPQYSPEMLRALLARLESEGFVLVPKEPTEKVLSYICDCDTRHECTSRDLPTLYKAMLAAAKDGEVDSKSRLKRIAAMQGVDLTKCPNCGGPADNGFSREIPPSPYYCKACANSMDKPFGKHSDKLGMDGLGGASVRVKEMK